MTGLAHPAARNSSSATPAGTLPLPGSVPAWVQRKKAENMGGNHHKFPRLSDGVKDYLRFQGTLTLFY